MTTTTSLEHFVHAQVDCWNKGDKQGFLNCYEQIAPNGLSVEIVAVPAMPAMDPWLILNNMWDKTQADINIKILCAVVAGNEAVTHHQNWKQTGELSSYTLETYTLEDGKLTARYFVSPA